MPGGGTCAVHMSDTEFGFRVTELHYVYGDDRLNSGDTIKTDPGDPFDMDAAAGGSFRPLVGSSASIDWGPIFTE